jgi:hypothetical protein
MIGRRRLIVWQGAGLRTAMGCNVARSDPTRYLNLARSFQNGLAAGGVLSETATGGLRFIYPAEQAIELKTNCKVT